MGNAHTDPDLVNILLAVPSRPTSTVVAKIVIFSLEVTPEVVPGECDVSKLPSGIAQLE